MAYPMRVELTAGGNVEIQPPSYNGHSWVMSKENALKLARWIFELIMGEAADNPLAEEKELRRALLTLQGAGELDLQRIYGEIQSLWDAHEVVQKFLRERNS